MKINTINYNPSFAYRRKQNYKDNNRVVGPDRQGMTRFYDSDGTLEKKVIDNGIDYIETNYYKSGQVKSFICPHGTFVYIQYYENGNPKLMTTIDGRTFRYNEDGSCCD